MDFSYFKYIKYINKHKSITTEDLICDFQISKVQALEVLKHLSQNELITVSNTKYVPTLKSKSFSKSFLLNWIYHNILAIIAIIISIIALFK